MQFELFGAKPSWEQISAVDAEIRLLHGFLSSTQTRQIFDNLLNAVPWRHDKIRLYGREHMLPRLQQWFGDEGGVYRWSGIEMVPEPWSPVLRAIKLEVETAARTQFNSLLVNLYRDGKDTVSWHSDDEPGLGVDPVIASVSLGASREFLLRHKTRREIPKISMTLSDGSLLLMAGPTQRCWEHSVPRRAAATGARINLTFRNIAMHRGKKS
jgi:alkylated DNA repair dioxygenase AlkB